MFKLWAVIVVGVVCFALGACFGVMLIALCMANGGSDDEDTGCYSPESKPQNDGED